MDTKLAKRAEVELSKYLALAVKTGAKVEMFSPAVDSVWHELLADGDNYRRISLKACGQVVGHDTTSKSAVPEKIGWIEEYHRQFGRMDDVWFRNHLGDLDVDIYGRYQATGEVVASWDCTPLIEKITKPPKKPAPSEPKGPDEGQSNES